jgi:hypothetical protein
MGINDGSRSLQKWLQGLVPGAFFYALPDLFVPNVIVHDLTSLMVSAFQSPSVKTGWEFVSYVNQPVLDFANYEEAPHFTTISLASLADLTQFCKAVEGDSAPTGAELLSWARADFAPKIDSDRCTYVLTRDNKRFLPKNRSMVHDHRYEAGEGDKDRPFSDEEIRHLGLHVRGARPMPGNRDFVNVDEAARYGDDQGYSSVTRRRAANTPAIRDAYQNYAPWALAQELTRHAGTAKVSKEEDHRFVLIDHVLSDFPEHQYLNGELHDLPRDWAKSSAQHMELIKLRSGTRLAPLKCIELGEADLKLAWFIEHLAEEGDHVLLRCNDSDVIYLLLLHMEHWQDCREGGEKWWRRLIFLDTMPQAEDRQPYRFICLNLLARGLTQKLGALGIAQPLVMAPFLALLCGSDYTQSHYFIPSAKILAAFQSEGVATPLGRLFELLAVDDEENEQLLASLLKNEAQLAELTPPVLIRMNYGVAHAFLRLLYSKRLGEDRLQKEFRVPSGKAVTWEELRSFNERRFGSHKQAGKYRFGDAFDMDVALRQVHWTLLHWANAHLGIPDFPSSDAAIEEENGLSLFGWMRAPKEATEGDGKERALKLEIDVHVYGERPKAFQRSAGLMIEPAIPTLQRRPKVLADLLKQLDNESGDKRWHTCHPRRVAQDDSLWNYILAQWLVGMRVALKPGDGVLELPPPEDEEDAMELDPAIV